jgi:hypothetical protein
VIVFVGQVARVLYVVEDIGGGARVTYGRLESSGVSAGSAVAAGDRIGVATEALYLGVALEEQCVCEWSGLRIPAVLCGMLTALSTPVDVMLEALSGVAAVDDGAAVMVFAELESVCVGRAGDADAVCDAIVSKRSVHGAGLDIGLLQLWLRRLPDAVSVECVASLFLFVV